MVSLRTAAGAGLPSMRKAAIAVSYYANPRGSAVAQTLFTSDFRQIYGALLENTTGEENYTE